MLFRSFGEISIRHPGPVTVRVEQDGREMARLEPAAPDPERWPALCDDIPSALPPNHKVPAKAHEDEKHCVSWASLWPDMTVPPRQEVLAEGARGASPPPGGTN